MKISFTGYIDEIKKSIDEFKAEEGFEIGEGEAEITVSKCDKGFSLEVSGRNAKIKYNNVSDFNRAFTIALYQFKNGEDISLSQSPHFECCGIMLDVSRGAVLRPEKVKDLVRRIAKMGFNQIMLYTEDTYKIDDYPYFGYMRGRYSADELSDMAEYAESLGIEMVPCIQTLGHLESALRWSAFSSVKDAESVLLIGEEKTYELIETMIKTVRGCFKTNKIHIGMDEAFGVGLGEYLLKNGYRNRFEILSEHLNKVVDICKKYDFEPMMWSDMFFRFATPDGEYYHEDAFLPDNVADLIPEGVSQVYWDYYHYDKKMYNTLISQHLKMNCPIIFAGGVWIWSGPSVNYEQTFKTTIPALEVCREHGIGHVVATLWGDDGAECDVYEALYGLQLYAEYNYCDDPTDKELRKMFKVCTGYDAEAFLLLDTEDYRLTPDAIEPESYFTKQVLYQNPLLGLFDKNFESYKLSEHYEALYNKLLKITAPKGLETLFECRIRLLKVLKNKCDIGIKLKQAYDKRDLKKLKELADTLRVIESDMELLCSMRMKLWFENNKPFGYEEVNNRLGAALASVRVARGRVMEFLNGDITEMCELEEERLYYNGVESLYVNEPFSKRAMVVRTAK